MFYVMAGLWLIIYVWKSFVSSDLRKSIVTLLVSTFLLGGLAYLLGSPRIAGVFLAVGFVPGAIRLATFRLTHNSR